MAIAIGLIVRVLDILLGAMGLLLVLRIVLQVFKVRWNSPAMKAVVAVTEPVLQVTNRWLGIPTYGTSARSYGMLRSDILSSAAALVVLWTVRTLLTWVLQLFVLVPAWFVQPLSSLGSIITYVIQLGFDLYGMALFVRVIFSWIRVPYSSRISRFLWTITEPVLAPIRSVLPLLPGVDISPLIAFFLLRFLQQIVLSLLSWIF